MFPPIARTDFGNAKFYYASASSSTITETSILSTTKNGNSCLASPNNITFTTTTKNTNYDSLALYMRGYDSDGTTVLFDGAVGYIPSSCYGTAGETYTFNIASSNKAYFFQFYIVGVTTTAKQTVAGDITVDYFIRAISSIGTSVPAGLPNITGVLGDTNSTDWVKGFANSTLSSGAFFTGTLQNKKGFASNSTKESCNSGFGFDASSSNSTYGNSTTVTPLSLVTQFLIKY